MDTEVMKSMMDQLSREDLVKLRKEAYPVRDIPWDILKRYRAFPYNMNDDHFCLLISDPTRWEVIDLFEKTLGRKAKVSIAPSEEIDALIAEFYENKGIEEIVKDAEEEGYYQGEESVEALRDMASEAPVIRLVNLIIKKAVEARASDIHFEPFEKEFRVRYRIDGVLHDVESPPKKLQAPITSRIKLMARMNIAERRLPQDGRIKMTVGGKNLDIRVSTTPTMFGESIVLRILNKEEVILDMEALGFEEKELRLFSSLIRSTHGIILVTGPTGSGKTTTLYAALSSINSPEKKIITVEDPVEYQLHGVNQIQVKPQIGLTFANILRSILRQDPDVILVGEIRDVETAEIAIHASLTGHLVFSTLHTNDAVGAVVRLRDMGIENYLISSSVIGVMAQRLVRVLCPKCREPYEVDGEIMEALKGDFGDIAGKVVKEGAVLYRAKGCEYCSFTGFRGRTGLFELMVVDEDMRRLILRDADSRDLKKKAISCGMRTLKEQGLIKAAKGITSVEEVLRVTG